VVRDGGGGGLALAVVGNDGAGTARRGGGKGAAGGGSYAFGGGFRHLRWLSSPEKSTEETRHSATPGIRVLETTRGSAHTGLTCLRNGELLVTSRPDLEVPENRRPHQTGPSGGAGGPRGQNGGSVGWRLGHQQGLGWARNSRND